jgi:hypothetical protein
VELELELVHYLLLLQEVDQDRDKHWDKQMEAVTVLERVFPLICKVVPGTRVQEEVVDQGVVTVTSEEVQSSTLQQIFWVQLQLKTWNEYVNTAQNSRTRLTVGPGQSDLTCLVSVDSSSSSLFSRTL